MAILTVLPVRRAATRYWPV